MASGSCIIPLVTTYPQFDNDRPDYRPGDAATYLLLALTSDTLAGPSTTGDPTGTISPDFLAMQPRLAKSWQETSDGEWIVRLRQGVLSNWGNEFTSEDVHWVFSKAFALHNIGEWRWGCVAGLKKTGGVEPLDRYTLKFSLRNRNPHFQSYLFFATPNMVDTTEIRKHVTPDDPWGRKWLANNVAGFGPYEVVSATENETTLKARPDYWAGASPITNVTLRQVASRDEGIDTLDSSEPSIVIGLRCDETRKLLKKPHVKVHMAWAGHTSLQIDFLSAPFNEKKVRHALSFATPYADIIEKGLLGLARPWRSPLKGVSAWYTDEFWKYETDVAKARTLLREAGYPDGFTTECYVPQRPDTIRIGEILRDAYAKIGITMNLIDITEAPPGWTPPLHIRTDCGHNLSEALYDLAHDYAPVYPILPAPGGPVQEWMKMYSRSSYLEDQFRNVLVEGDSSTRESMCRNYQQTIVEFAPCVFLAENLMCTATNTHVDPWAYSPTTRLFQLVQYQNSGTRYLPPS